MKPVIGVDWDGTCVEQVWPDEGDWLPGAVDALRRLCDTFHVYIWSTRIVGVSYDDWTEPLPQEAVDKEIAYIRRMLDCAGLSAVDIFVGYPGDIVGKLSAVAYIDDKAITFRGDWEEVYDELLERGLGGRDPAASGGRS